MAKIAFSEAQQKALDLSGGKLVVAGAGSGKTTVLTERYIRLLEQGKAEPRHIVAMTFTRKAAAQLLDRIQNGLWERQKEADPSAAERWQTYRDAMAWARIGTIHSICARLLRAWPMEAGVDRGFAIVETLTDDLTRVQTMVRRLAVARDPHLAVLLERMQRPALETLILQVMKDPFLLETLRQTTATPSEAEAALDSFAGMLSAAVPGGIVPPETGAHKPLVEMLIHLGGVVLPMLQKRQATRSQLSYDDLEHFIYRLLTTHDAAATAIRRSIRYLLVDEFQDTSTLQWQIIRELARDEDGIVNPGKLFLVGDEKQSIYSFRKANVTVVGHGAETMTGPSTGESDHPARVNLNDNFRSTDGIINPLNAAFQRMFAPETGESLPFEANPQDLHAHRHTSLDGPKVELAIGLDMEGSEALHSLAARLRREVEDGLITIDDKQGRRPLQYEDIAILFRARTHLGELEDALRSHGVPFQTAAGRVVFDRREVQDMAHLIAALADARDRLAATGALRGPVFCLSDEHMAALSLLGSDPLTVLLQRDEDEQWSRVHRFDVDTEPLQFAVSLWNTLVEMSAEEPPSAILQYALEASGAWGAYAVGLRGAQRVANLENFLQWLRERESEGLFTLRRLNLQLKALMESGSSEGLEEASVTRGQGVRLYTIHKAKGLEFPYVVMVGLSSSGGGKGKDRGNLLIPVDQPYAALTEPDLGALDPMPGNGTLHTLMRDALGPMEQQAELKRLQYVAATRAKDRLLLTTHLKRRSNGNLSFLDTSPLALWLHALGVPHDKQNVEPTSVIEGVLVSLMEKPPAGRTALEPSSELADTLLTWRPTPDPTASPDVHLADKSAIDRYSVGITAFASWIAEPTDERLSAL
ncbi:AAA family ATPase, partial [bacterium]|nr:AAA family ATPase [bacterium]